MAAHVDHRVDRRTAADNFAARQLDAAPTAAGFGLGLPVPVDTRVLEDAVDAGGDVDEGVRVPAACVDVDE